MAGSHRRNRLTHARRYPALKSSFGAHRPEGSAAQKPDVFAGGTMRAVSELEFPISTTITGALLIIEPGALRALHWHPNAAEWQLYLKGSGRVTVFGSLCATSRSG